MTDPSVKAKLLDEFRKLDADNSGFLDHQELKKCLNNLYSSIDLKMTDADVDNLIKQVDKNGDGKVSFEEFVNLL